MTTPEISIIIPIKDEQANLSPLVEEIRSAMRPLGAPFEILIVDDGSTDASWKTLTDIRSSCPELRALRLDCNHGQSAAMDAAIRNANGAILVSLDGDLQNSPADIPLLLSEMNNADMVCGYRKNRHDTPWRRFQSRFANAVRNLLTGDSIRDTGCSLRAFRREVFANLTLYDGMHRFLPTLARMQGFKIVEVPVSHRPRAAGRSKYSMRNRAFRALRDLIAVRWMLKRRLKYRVTEELPTENPSASTDR